MTTTAAKPPAPATTPEKAANALAQRRETMLQHAERIDELASGALERFREAGSFAAELSIASAMNDLRNALTPEMMAPVMSMMNSDIGFRTDRDPNVTKDAIPYPVEIVRECFIESKLRGFSLVGNEWNIIAGRFYAAKNGLRRKVSRWPGLTDFKETYDVPRLVGDKGAIVKVKATWKLNGADQSLEAEIPVRVNAYMGADAILGKAERKLMKRVHDRISGVITPEGDASEGEFVDIKPQAPRQVGPPRFKKESATAPASETPPETEDAAPEGAERVRAAHTQGDSAAHRAFVDHAVGLGYNFDSWCDFAEENGLITPQYREDLTSFAEVSAFVAGACMDHRELLEEWKAAHPELFEAKGGAK